MTTCIVRNRWRKVCHNFNACHTHATLPYIMKCGIISKHRNRGFHDQYWTFIGRSSQNCLTVYKEVRGVGVSKTTIIILIVECHYKYVLGAIFANPVVFLLCWSYLDWYVLCSCSPGKYLTINELVLFCFHSFYCCFCHVFYTWALSNQESILFPHITLMILIDWLIACLLACLLDWLEPINVLFSILSIVASKKTS